MNPLRARRGLSSPVLVALAATGLALAAVASATSSEAAGHPLPVQRSSGKNYDTPDPGVLLDGSTFYAFSTGGGLHESSASVAAGPWSTPSHRLTGALPSWADSSRGIWAPDLIKTTSSRYVVYFSAALKNTSGHKTGSDARPASGARCIGTAQSGSPLGRFTADAKPLVCFRQFSPADNMDGDPGQRERGEGVIDASPVFVTRGGHKQLFLVYKTQGDPGAGQHATIRMVRLDAASGTAVLGESHQLLSSGTGSFADTIEAPSLVQHRSWFILFVAHGNFGNCGYSTQWFKSQHIWAWSNSGGSTLLSSASTSGLCGPGSADVTTSRIAGQYRIFFHAWVKESNGVISTTPLPSSVVPHENKNAARVMYAAVLTFRSDGFTPVLGAFQGQ